jgi:hypothetical protein
MAMRPFTVLALASGIFAGAAATAIADEVSDGIAALPGTVEDVRIGGTWGEGERIGAYRIVVARTGGEAVTARMFIQWIVYQEAGGATVENSIEITELDELDLDIVDYTTEADAEGLSVYIQTLNPNAPADESYELFVFSPTDYRFGPASN